MVGLGTASLSMFLLPFEGLRGFFWPVLLMFILVNILFARLCTKDPGYIQKSPNVSFLKLNQYFDPAFLCPTCEIMRP